MKYMRKLVALFAALALVLSMAVPAFAAAPNTYTITVKNGTGTYKAYQIFAGKLETTAGGQLKLSDIQWGNGVNQTKLATALGKTDAQNVADGLTTEELAEAFANKIANALDEANAIKSTGDTLLNLEAGYYLIMSDTVPENGAATKFIMRVTQNETVQAKTSYPEVEKKVKENVKFTTDGGYGNGYSDTADYNIGDDVPFKLIGTVPDMSKYTSYKYIFHDTLASSFDAAQNVKVYLATEKVEAAKMVEVTNEFKVNVNGSSLTVSTENLKAIVANYTDEDYKYVVVTYTAKLNSNALIDKGTDNNGEGNYNKVKLEYSNNPNVGGEGDTGNTPEDKVIVFTYKLDVKKVDATNNGAPLKDVGFKLYKKVGEETKWAKVDGNNKLIGWADTEAQGTELKSGEDGKFGVIGLDDGTYFIKETSPLPGYNGIDDVEIVINSDAGKGKQNGTGVVADADTITISTKSGENSTPAEGNVVTIENRMGATLPSTGGIGTTIFYVVGGGLMVAAAVLLITKKRMENK